MRKEKTGRFARLRVLAERPEIGILIPLLLIMAVTAVINPNFMTAKNFSSVFKSIPFIAVVTLGAAFPLITGNVDISNGRFVGLTGMLFGVFLVNTRLGLAGSIAACLLIGCILGLLNGFLVVQLRMAGFIATMGTMYICGGLRYLVNGGSVMSNLPYGVKDFAEQTPLGVSWFLWIVVVLYVLAGFVLYKTPFGRRVYAIGSNAEVARLQGVKVERIGICAYVISSVLAAVGGVMAAMDIGSAAPSTGNNWEFKAVAGCVVGGVSLSGGRGSAVGIAIGVFTVYIISNIINMIQLSNYWSDVFTGCILAGAVMIDVARQRKKLHE